MRLRPDIGLPLLVLTLGLAVACPAKAKEEPAPAPTPTPAPAPEAAEPQTPPPAVEPQERSGVNGAFLGKYESLIGAVEKYVAEGGAYPQYMTQAIEEFLRTEEEIAIFGPEGALKQEHTWMGFRDGHYHYSQVLMKDGSQAGYLFMGYGDLGSDPPAEAEESAFFAARNWIMYNEASTDPRLPNDVPEGTILVKFVVKEGVGKTPPPDYEAPPQESLVDSFEGEVEDS